MRSNPATHFDTSSRRQRKHEPGNTNKDHAANLPLDIGADIQLLYPPNLVLAQATWRPSEGFPPAQQGLQRRRRPRKRRQSKPRGYAGICSRSSRSNCSPYRNVTVWTRDDDGWLEIAVFGVVITAHGKVVGRTAIPQEFSFGLRRGSACYNSQLNADP